MTHCPHPHPALEAKVISHSWLVHCHACTTTWHQDDPEIPDRIRKVAKDSLGIMISTEEAERLDMTLISPGKQLPWKPSGEGVQFLFMDDAFSPVLGTLTLSNVTQRELDGFHSGPTRFALVAGTHALQIAVSVPPELPWSDGSWQAAAQRPVVEPGLPHLADGNHCHVQFALVEQTTGIVLGCRRTSWPPTFYQAVYQAVQSQLTHQSSIQDGIPEIDHWVQTYSTIDDLIADRATAICRGGQAG